jgi:hypothetical protein
MSHPLAVHTFAEYTEAREKFIISLERKHKDLSAYASRKEASQWVIDKGNKELTEAYEFIQQVETLMEQMHGIAKSLHLQKQINRLKAELNL